jgi:hypothetical protein
MLNCSLERPDSEEVFIDNGRSRQSSVVKRNEQHFLWVGAFSRKNVAAAVSGVEE